MASASSQGANLLRGWRKQGRFDTGIGSHLPEAYIKFWREWKIMKPVAVHYIPETSHYQKDELSGEVKHLQDVALPVIYPKEQDAGIWGGEGVIKGFQKRHHLRRRVPHFWVPVLRRSVIYSEVLDQYISVIVTDRTMKLIHDNYGFDHYLLKTPACDLKSALALNLKRQILLALQMGCPAYIKSKTKQNEVYNQYKQYLSAYTPEEIEWYGLTFFQACEKFIKNERSSKTVQSLKTSYRSELIEKLRQVGIEEAMETQSSQSSVKMSGSDRSWLNKINPFGKKDLS